MTFIQGVQPAELIVWPGGKHADVLSAPTDLPQVADGFDKHLVKKEGKK